MAFYHRGYFWLLILKHIGIVFQTAQLPGYSNVEVMKNKNGNLVHFWLLIQKRISDIFQLYTSDKWYEPLPSLLIENRIQGLQ